MLRNHGVTLIELIVLLAILAISCAIAIPSFASLIDRTRAETEISRIHRFFNAARSAAVSQGVPVTVCILDSAKACDSSTHWHGELIAFFDQDRNNRLDAAEQPYRTLDLNPTNARIELKTFNGKSLIIFSPLGHSAISNGTLTYCSLRSGQPYQLILNRQGRIRTLSVPITTSSTSAC